MLHCVGVKYNQNKETIGFVIYNSDIGTVETMSKQVVASLLRETHINNLIVISCGDLLGDVIIKHISIIQNEFAEYRLKEPKLQGDTKMSSIWTVLNMIDGYLVCMNCEGKRKFIKIDTLVNKKYTFSNFSYIIHNNKLAHSLILTIADNKEIVPDRIINRREKDIPVNNKLEMLGSPFRVSKQGSLIIENVKELYEQQIIRIPAICSNIKNNTFSKYTNLREIYIPSSVKRIGGKAFRDCRNLEKVHFTQGLEEIGQCAFSGCNIKQLILPVGLKKIGHSAFFGCYSIEEIYVPDTVEEIEYNAFDLPLFLGFEVRLKKVRLPKKFMTKQKLDDIGIYRQLKDSKGKIELIES